MIKLDLGILPVRKKTEVIRAKRPSWYKAGEEERERFKLGLEEKLQRLDSPECLSCTNPKCKNQAHSEERDGHMLDIMGALIESSHEHIPMSGGKEATKEKEVMPGWKEMVEPHRERAILWHSIWQSCGRPNTGEVKNIMASTRNKYHYAVRKCKKLVGET